MKKLPTRIFGKTGKSVSVLGLGAMPMSVDGRPSEEDCLQVLKCAFELGVTFIDTADAYCLNEHEKHHNERLIEIAIERYGNPKTVFVATKGGLMRPEGRWETNGDPKHLEKTIGESYQALGGQRPIDLWQFHAPDPKFPIKESLKAARDAVEKGLVRYVGVSNFSVKQIEDARAVVDIVSVQNQYSPFHRQPENDGVLDYCEKEDLVFLPWSPYGGWYRYEKLRQLSTLDRIASKHDRSVYQAVLAWLRQKSPCVLPIPGASQLETLENSMAGFDFVLSDEECEKLDQEFSVL